MWPATGCVTGSAAHLPFIAIQRLISAALSFVQGGYGVGTDLEEWEVFH